MELISIVVPVYKVEPYLDKCISSIVNQTYKNHSGGRWFTRQLPGYV